MKSFLKNQRGFTLVELVIASGLSAFLISGAIYFLGDNEKFQRLLGIKQDQTADQVLGRAIIYKDLRGSSPSFYFLKTETDTYTHADHGEKPMSSCKASSEVKRPFWYTTDEVFCQGVHVELKDIDDKLEFFIVNQHNGSNSDIFSPEDFYDADTFKDDKFKDALEDAGWRMDGFFKIQASSPVMDDGEMKIYGAVVNGGTLDLEGSGTDYDILSKFCDIASISSLDEFLRCLPGTGLPRVRIVPVTKVTYTVKRRLKKGIELKYLERSITRVGTTDAKAGLLEGLESVRFYRGNTASPSMSFAVTFESRDNYSRKTRKP